MILAINTATMQFGLAMLDENGGLISELMIKPRGKNFRRFMPSIHSLFELSNISPREIKAIVIVKGPGSFTGLRVGLSAAKGMAQGLGIPIIGVSGLEVMADQLSYSDYLICPFIPSRREEVFLACFKKEKDDHLTRLMDDSCISFDDISKIIRSRTIFLGTDFHIQGALIKRSVGNNAILAPSYLWNLRASSAGTLGYNRWLENDFDDLRELVPAYMRPPDIRPNPYSLRDERDLSGKK